MKKYIVIALAALVAFAACTKVNPEEKKAEKISFTVANYMPQTKANSSLDSEGYNSFNCYAWYFGAPMQYMNNVEVLQNDAKTEWAPAQDYYWPKTGYINFYSYAGSQAPTVTASDDKKTITVAYTNATIAATDNFMVADPALHFGIDNYNANLVTINDEQGDFNYTGTNAGQYTYTATSQNVYTGVPTLFHHMLAKVAFVIKLQTSSASANTAWTVKILNDDSNKSNIEALKKGTLTLKNTDAATTSGLGQWTPYNGTSAITDAAEAKIAWIPSTPASAEVMPFDNKVELTLAAGATTSDQDTLLAVRTVMPQVTSGVALNLAYEVSATHTGETTPFMTEVITVSKPLCGAATATPAPATIAPTAWNMNQITLYTITIDPVGKRVTFDPAVVEWDSVAGDEIKL